MTCRSTRSLRVVNIAAVAKTTESPGGRPAGPHPLRPMGMHSALARAAAGLLAVGIFVVAPHGVALGEPTDPAAGLLDPAPEARATAAAKVGALDLVAAGPAIPVLVEALDDEAAPVRAAARTAILDLAGRAAPSVLRDLSEAPIGDGPDSAVIAVLRFGRALPLTELPRRLESGDHDVRDVWLSMALFGVDDFDQEWMTKGALRTSSVESARRSGAEKSQAAAAAAFLAFRVVRSRARGAGEPLPTLVAAGTEKSLSALLPAKAKGARAEVAAQFVAVTGLGDAAVVPGLAALLEAEPDLKPLPTPIPRIRASWQAAGALGRLSATVPGAKAALEALDAERFAQVAIAVARGGAASLVAARAVVARAAAAPAEDRVIRAANAVLDGDVRDPALVPVLAAVLADPTLPWWPSGLALDALGRLGAVSASTVPAIEAALREDDLSHAVRVALAAALIRIRPGHEAAQTALVGEVTGKFGTPDSRRGTSEIEAPGRAIEALSEGGVGPEVVSVLSTAVSAEGLGSDRDVLLRAETIAAAARGLGRAAKAGGSTASARLVALPSAKLPGDDSDESAAGILRSGELASIPFRLRTAALDGLAELGTVRSAEGAKVRALLDSPDPRIRWRASRTLRLVRIADR